MVELVCASSVFKDPKKKTLVPAPKPAIRYVGAIRVYFMKGSGLIFYVRAHSLSMVNILATMVGSDVDHVSLKYAAVSTNPIRITAVV